MLMIWYMSCCIMYVSHNRDSIACCCICHVCILEETVFHVVVYVMLCNVCISEERQYCMLLYMSCCVMCVSQKRDIIPYCCICHVV